MKRHINFILVCCILILVPGLHAQSPSLINYQGTARLSDGTPLDNRTISIKFDLLQGSSSGSVIATESKTLQTNALGLFSTLLGQSMDLSAINWQGNTIFLQVSMDTSAGSSFVPVGVQQMVSVPYAIHASSVPTSYTNNILTIGSSTYALAPTVAVVPNTTITVSGLGTVTSAGTNTFDINIPAPTFSGQGATTVNGAYPNYTISSATPSIALSATAATGPTVTSSGSSFSLNVPPPTFSNTGQTIITGSYPDFIVNTPTVGATPITTINASGLVTISNPATNSFVVGVPAPTLGIASGSISITGGNSVALPTTPSVTAAGIATVSTGPNYVVGVPAQSLSIASGSISITSGNSVALPTTPSVTAAGIATVSTGPNYVVGVPAPTLGIASGSISITGGNSVALPTTPSVTAAGMATVSAGPNYVVGVPAQSLSIASGSISITSGNSVALPTTPSVTAAGIATVSTGPNYLVGVQAPIFTNSGQTIISGTYPNYSVNTPTIANTSIALTATAAAGPSLSTIGTNSFNLNIPPGTDWSLLGNAGTSTVSNFIGTTDNVALNFRVNNQRSGIIDPVLFNTAFGYQGLAATVTGSNNAAFGYGALNANTGASGNSAFGSGALNTVTSGDNNTAMGYNSLVNNGTGSFNTAIGASAMQFRTSGVQNVALGGAALSGNISGNYNTALGYSAGNTNTGTGNVFVGYTAGTNNTGSSNVFIGYQAGANITGNGKLVIANSNTTVSPLIYGDFTNNYLGIGTTNANAPLQFDNSLSGRKIVLWEGTNNDHQVYGFGINLNVLRYQVDASTADHVFYSGINATSSKELMRVKGTGSVGIGTSSPASIFHVSNSAGDAIARIETPSASFEARMEFFKFGGSFSAAVGFYPGNASLRLRTMNTTPIVFEPNSVERMRVDNNGNVGIGTTSPSFKLEVSPGSTSISDATGHTSLYHGPGTGGALKAESNSTGISGGATPYAQAYLAGYHGNSPTGANIGVWGNATGNGVNGYGIVATHGTIGSEDKYVGLAGPSYAGIFVGGNVGIGTTSPNYQLELSTNSAAKPGSNVWTIASDARLKTNVHAYESGLADVLKINPVWYTYTGEAGMPKETFVGIIAQDLQKVAPYMVKEWTYTKPAVIRNGTGNQNPGSQPEGEKTNYLSVDNGAMTYMLINAVKEQQAQIEKQQKQIEELKKTVDELLKK